MIPANWEKESEAHQKAYKRLLEKGNKNKILKALPELHEEASEKINCLECANCCKNYSPRFKNPDIKRIAKLLKMKEGDFVAKYLFLDKDNDYVLQQKPCPFLAADNTCDIYEDRPSDCRRYPYTDEDVLIKRVPLTLKNATVCPITFTVLERLLEMEGK
ncbi:MAG: YkgJ family cysteine cluster protein [Flavipsychrobacter sp.]